MGPCTKSYHSEGSQECGQSGNVSSKCNKGTFFRTHERILTAGAMAESARRDMFGHSQVSGRGSSEGELFDVTFKVVQTGHVLWRWAGRLCRRKFRPKLHYERRHGGKHMRVMRSNEIVADGLNRRSQCRPKRQCLQEEVDFSSRRPFGRRGKAVRIPKRER